VSLSTGDIAKQNNDKFAEYKKNCGLTYSLAPHIESVSKGKTSSKQDIEYSIPDGYDVYTMGVDSFDSGTLLYARGYLESFLFSLKNQGKQIYFIRDEAHIGESFEKIIDKLKTDTTLADLLDKENKQSVNLQRLYHFFSKRLYLSATLSDKVIVDVEMTEKEAEKEHLIKSKTEFLSTEESWTDRKVLQKAIDDFKQIKARYLENFSAFERIHPAILIQIGLSDQGDEQLK
jgi:hypothetical protein